MIDIIFLLCQITIYVSFLFIDSNIIKYISIIFCVIYAYYFKKGRVVVSLLLLADYCLLIQDYYKIGVLLFILVQLCYQIVYFHQFRWYLLILSLLCFNSLYLLSFLYAICSLMNIITAMKYRHWLLITLILLACCDINVMLQYLTNTKKPLIWFFYLPSQVYFVMMAKQNKAIAKVGQSLMKKPLKSK